VRSRRSAAQSGDARSALPQRVRLGATMPISRGGTSSSQPTLPCRLSLHTTHTRLRSIHKDSPLSDAPPSEQTILTLVRHGQTSANLDAVWHGSSDTPLTDHGQEQALRVAGFLAEHSADASEIYASPLIRAQHTAAPIAKHLGLTVQIDENLREYDIGSWEGKTFQELQEVHRLWDHIATNLDFAPHGGESPRQVLERMTTCLHGLHARHKGKRIIIVTHGGALAMTLGRLLGDESRFVHVMKNCAVTELVLEPAPELLSFNLVAHLEEPAQ
jgi:probable phosphoglycerate mutase